MFFILVDVGVSLDCLQIGPQDSNAVEEVVLEIKAMLLPQPELIVVVIQTLLGHSQTFGCLLQTHLLDTVLALVEFSPLLDNLDDLKDNPLLASLLLD